MANGLVGLRLKCGSSANPCKKVREGERKSFCIVSVDTGCRFAAHGGKLFVVSSSLAIQLLS